MKKYLRNNEMDISIIIVNYNTKELTKNCIDSIYEKTKDIEFEVILVDNDSNDGSKELFERDKKIEFVEAGKNLGFGKANNLGLTRTTGKYIFFLNSDTILQNNAVYEFWKYCEKHENEKLGAVGCILSDGNNVRCHSYAKLTSWKDIVLSYLVAPINKSKARNFMGIDDQNESSDGFEVGYVTGADLFVSKKVIDECGVFDPDFFMYSEEAEMQYRFKKHGYKNIIIHEPKIMHLEGMSQAKRKKPTMKKIMMTHRSLLLYVKKTSTKFQYMAFRFIFPLVRSPFMLLSRYPVKDKIKYAKLLFSKI